MFACLREQILEHLLKALDTEALAKMGAVGVVRNRSVHA